MALAQEGKAPSIFAKMNSRGVPMYAILASFFVGCLSFLSIFWGQGAVFTYLLALTGVSGIITWISISFIHLRFRAAFAAQGIRAQDVLVFMAPFFPVGPIIGIVLGTVILLGEGYAAFATQTSLLGVLASLFNVYFGLFFFAALFLGYKLRCKTRPIPLEDVDLTKFVDGASETQPLLPTTSTQD